MGSALPTRRRAMLTIWRLARMAGVRASTAAAYMEGRWVGGWAKRRLDEAGLKLEREVYGPLGR